MKRSGFSYLNTYPDYYVMVGEEWNQKTRRFTSVHQQDYRHGIRVNLPNHEKTEIITFCC